MGFGTQFDGHNRRFLPPPGDDRVEDLFVFDNGHVIVSCWQFSPEELEEIRQTGKVYLTLFSRGMQPVYVGGEQTTRDLIQDYGGAWKR